jgi:hypothetical protein
LMTWNRNKEVAIAFGVFKAPKPAGASWLTIKRTSEQRTVSMCRVKRDQVCRALRAQIFEISN